MASIGPFKGGAASTSVALSTTLTSVTTAGQVAGDGETMRVINGCNVPVTVDFGPSGVTATITSPYVIGAGQTLNIAVPRGALLYAAAMPVATAFAAVYFMRGDGNG